MKIALIGASRSGKTSYFGGVYFKYRDEVTFPALCDQDITSLIDRGDQERFSFSIGIDDFLTERYLSSIADGLSSIPMEWPDSNNRIVTSGFSTNFHFKNIFDLSISSYKRDIEFYDPPGGVLKGAPDNSPHIISILASCDSFIVFLDGDILLNAASNNNDQLFRYNSRIGGIFDILRSAAARLSENDILPVCFIISKCDKLNENVINIVRRVVYDDLLKPFSSENRHFMISLCPIALCAPGGKPGGEVFAAHNLELPFLFSVAGTIFRNAVAREHASATSDAEARRFEARAREVEHGGWWKRLTAYLGGSGVRASTELAQFHRSQSGRLITEARDDRELATKLWRHLAVEGPARGVAILMGGEEIDPSKVSSA